jgi:hypothetical protein
MKSRTYFLFSTSSRPALGFTQPSIQWALGTLSLGLKRLGLEADYSPPASAEVKKMCIYTSTPPCAFMVQCLISLAQGQLTFLPFTSSQSPESFQ